MRSLTQVTDLYNASSSAKAGDEAFFSNFQLKHAFAHVFVLLPHVKRNATRRCDQRTAEQFHAGKPLTDQTQRAVVLASATPPPQHHAHQLEHGKAKMQTVGERKGRRPAIKRDEDPS